MNIVIIRFSSMGDVLLQTAFINWLTQNYKELTITYITSKEFAPLLKGFKQIDKVITINRSEGINGLRKIAKIVNNELKPEVVFDLHQTLRARLLKLLCWRTLFITVDKRTLERNILIKLKINLMKNLESIHQRIINDFSFLFPIEQRLLEKPLTKMRSNINDKVNERNIIIFSPVASFTNKKWPLSSYKKLLELFLNDEKFNRYTFKILGGPSDEYCSEMMIENTRVENLQGKLSLEETFQVLDQACLTITNDTGIGHMSESCFVPVISFFGPTATEFGFAPHLDNSFVFENKTLECRPCSATGKDKCIMPELLCMNSIAPTDVYDKTKELLSL